MITWQEFKNRIQTEIHPNHSCILKADGKGRRLVTSNKRHKVAMSTGKKTSKAITYDMIRYAFHTLSVKGSFDSKDFRDRFDDEYRAAPCRFSMTGGILVELDVANIEPSPKACRYTKKP